MTEKPSPPLPWEAAFLDAVGAGYGAVKAAHVAGIHRSTPYQRRIRNTPFAQAWAAAACLAGDDKGSAKGRGKRKGPPAQVASRGPHWRKAFLETLAETSNVTAAAARAGVPSQTVYKQRRDDPAFRAQWIAALLEGYEHLEMETLHRLRMGTGKDDPKFDIANALRLLALHRQTVAGERARREEEDVDTILSELDAKIDAMRAREREAARIAHEAANPDRHDLG